MKHFPRPLLCAILIFCLLLSGCSTTADPEKHIDQILNACSKPNNIFPSDQISVEFLEYDLPDAEQNSFSYGFRFVNVSERPLNMKVLGFYNLELETYIRHGNKLLSGDFSSLLTLDPNHGWSFSIPLTPVETWDSYSEEEQNTMIALANTWYFEIVVDKETYYCILDFENQKVISVI